MYWIKGRTINEAWFRTIMECLRSGEEYIIDQGEYQGQKRKEIAAVVEITSPGIRPLAASLPRIIPTTDQDIEDYFHNYLMSLEKSKNETYRYGHWIAPAWERCCELLAKGDGGCNQATISLGSGPGGFDLFGGHPPCLRLIDMRLSRGNVLHFYLYFRSWDLIAGFPENLGGIQMLKELCGAWISGVSGKSVKDGSIVAISKGIHIYDHFWDLVAEYAGEEK